MIKAPVKWLVRSGERKRVRHENGVRRKQDQAIHQFDASASSLIVFLIQGPDRGEGREKISGGVMSIVSLCEESAKLKDIHGSEVILCTLPNELLIFKHELFQNHSDVFRFSQLRKYFGNARSVILHIPEYTCDYFLKYLSAADKHWLQGMKNFHINVLNQNIRLMPPAGTIEKLKMVAARVTITTAHERYCNAFYRSQYDVPIHKFSVWISPEKYLFTSYAKKENLIVVSPDVHPQKETILQHLRNIPGLRVQIIQGLTYEEYKKLVSRAKWTLTFGEGLDGYIIEPVFSGAIGFAVYNEEFFTTDFESLGTMYGSYDDLLNKISTDIQRLDEEISFNTYQQEQFSLCASHYSQDAYHKNITAFYEGKYTLP